MRRLPATLAAFAVLVGGVAVAESAVEPVPSSAATATPRAKPVCPSRRAPKAQFARCIVGTAGPDRLVGTTGRDRIDGAGGNDTIVGGAGNDDITGGPGRDTISAGDGNDVIDVRDGAADKAVVCGAGTDTVYADRADRQRISSDCERVRYRAR